MRFSTGGRPGSSPARPSVPGRGFTLVELLIGGVILIMVALPVGFLMSSSQGTVQRVDVQREARMIIDHIVERIEAQDLTKLWNDFGGPKAGSEVGAASNPLKIDADILTRITELNITAKLSYRFFKKTEIKILEADNELRTGTGLLWLQAGEYHLTVVGGARGGGIIPRFEINEDIRRAIYCPMILGRPGLALNQCPAVNKALRDDFVSKGVD